MRDTSFSVLATKSPVSHQKHPLPEYLLGPCRVFFSFSFHSIAPEMWTGTKSLLGAVLLERMCSYWLINHLEHARKNYLLRLAALKAPDTEEVPRVPPVDCTRRFCKVIRTKTHCIFNSCLRLVRIWAVLLRCMHHFLQLGMNNIYKCKGGTQYKSNLVICSHILHSSMQQCNCRFTFQQ